MKKINIIIVSVSAGFGVMCFIWGLMWMVMAKDLGNQLENRICICEVES